MHANCISNTRTHAHILDKQLCKMNNCTNTHGENLPILIKFMIYICFHHYKVHDDDDVWLGGGGGGVFKPLSFGNNVQIIIILTACNDGKQLKYKSIYYIYTAAATDLNFSDVTILYDCRGNVNYFLNIKWHVPRRVMDWILLLHPTRH